MLLERGSETFESSSFANTKQNRFQLEGSCLVCLFCLVCLHIHRDIGCLLHRMFTYSKAVFLNRRTAAWSLASIIPGRERPEEATICYKISLVQLITNLNVILYLSTCHTL